MTAHFVSFLYPYVRRGNGPLFKWVMLYQMFKFEPGQLVFLGDQDYFSELDIPFDSELEVSGLTFRVPSRERFRSFETMEVNVDFEPLASTSRGMLDIFRKLLTQEYPPLKHELARLLGQLANRFAKPLCVLTWANCPSLVAATSTVGARIVHNEIGPLRSPRFKGSVYFDFGGVNGKTSTVDEYRRFQNELRRESIPLRSLQEIRTALSSSSESLPESDDNAKVGIALQVEDDSNILAFSNGWSAVELLTYARDLHGRDNILIRSHPQAKLSIVSSEYGEFDQSLDSLTFIARCREIITINSSVGVEAALFGRPITLLGDAAAAILAPLGASGCDESSEEVSRRLNFYFLAYLIPSTLLFDYEYYQWRLTEPTFRELIEFHSKEMHALQTAPQNVEAIAPADCGTTTDDSLDRRMSEWLHSRDVSSQIGSLKESVEWLSKQRDLWQKAAEEQSNRIQQLDSALRELSTSNAWLVEQRDAWQKLAEDREAACGELQQFPDRSREALARLTEQREGPQRNGSQYLYNYDISDALTSINKAVDWLRAQRHAYKDDSYRHSAEENDNGILMITQAMARLQEGVTWLSKQSAAWTDLVLEREAEAGSLRTELAQQQARLKEVAASLDELRKHPLVRLAAKLNAIPRASDD